MHGQGSIVRLWAAWLGWVLAKAFSGGVSVTLTGGQACRLKISWSPSIGPRLATPGSTLRSTWRAPVGHIFPAPTFYQKRTPRPPVRAVLGKLRLSGIEGEWHLLADGASAALIDLAKSVDLAIVGQRAPNSEPDGASRLRPEDIVMTAGRPVLIVPYAGTFEMVGKRILFAWDGTREANRAMHDALPLFTDADATVVFVGSNERELAQHRPALDRVIHHLHHHGVAAKPEETLRGGLAV